LTSIGNDIVALQCTDPKRTKQKRFYSKILSPEEIEFFKSNGFQTLSFENFVWLAWSVKESVYKFHKRHQRNISFAPTKITINEFQLPSKQNDLHLSHAAEGISFKRQSCYSCEVRHDSLTFYTRTFVTDKLIFTVAGNSECFNNVHWGIKEIKDSGYIEQSLEVRAFAIKKLRKFFLSNDVGIEKNECGYPVIVQQSNIPLSFSHHGKFVGYAFVLNEPMS